MKYVLVGVLGMMVWNAAGCRPAVEIIGHRGASYDAPENTMAAIQLAWDQGVNVEVDVYLSKDNRIVVIHDASTKRTGGVNLKVKNTAAARLRELDVGSFKAPQFAGARIPFLEEVLAALPPARRLYIEIKCGREILPELRRVLADSGKMSQVVIIGFDLATIAEAKELIATPTYWLRSAVKDKKTGRPLPHDPNLIRIAKDGGLDGLDVAYAGVTPEWARAVKASRLEFYVWTVDDPIEARRLTGLGADGITTNRPAWLREQLRN